MPKKPRESFESIARRVNGISTPFGGISWNPPEDKRDIVRRLVTRLEDKRALYYDYHTEYGPWVEKSVIEMRSILTEALQTCSDDDKLSEPIRAMRAACRRFLDDMGNPNISRLAFFQQDAMMWYKLGELRAIFGLHLARLCATYGVDVEDELASIFPPPDEGPASE